MSIDDIFRLTFGLTFVAALTISGTFRASARRAGGAIPRAREGRATMAARLLFAAPLFLAIAAYIVNPNWIAWAALDLPTWLRAAGALGALAAIPLVWWVFRSLGRNVSETVLTKDEHVLVTHGPYRWIRHPLYTVATLLFFSLGLVSESSLLIAAAVAAFLAIARFAVPREETQLEAKFGDAYRTYRQRTPAYIPRLAPHAAG